MTYYVGLDVALRSVSACVIDDQGKIVKEAKMDAEVEAIVSWLAISKGVPKEQRHELATRTFGSQTGTSSP